MTPSSGRRAGFTLLEVLLAASILVVIAGASIAAFLFFTRNQEVSNNFGDLHRNALVLQEVIALDLERIGRVATFDVADDPMVASGAWLTSVSGAMDPVHSWVLQLRNDDADRTSETVTYTWDTRTGALTRSSSSGDTRVFRHVSNLSFSPLESYRVTVAGAVNESWLLGSGALGLQVPFEGTVVLRMR